MSSGIEGIGDKFLLRPYEKTVNNGTEPTDRYDIGKELGLIDEQIDNLVNVLVSYGYIKKVGSKDIELLAEGRKKVEI